MELSINLKRLSSSMTFLSKLYCLERRVWPWPSSSALKKLGGKSFIIQIAFLRRVSVLAMASCLGPLEEGRMWPCQVA